MSTRVSMTLESIEVDGPAANPCYAPDSAGVLQAWHEPTPGLMCWIQRTITRQLERQIPGNNTHEELLAMKARFQALAKRFPAGHTPEAPTAPEGDEFELMAAFVDDPQQRSLSEIDPNGPRTYGTQRKPHRIIAWRPALLVAAAAPTPRELPEEFDEMPDVIPISRGVPEVPYAASAAAWNASLPKKKPAAKKKKADDAGPRLFG